MTARRRGDRARNPAARETATLRQKPVQSTPRKRIALLDAVRADAERIRARIEATTARAASTGCLVWLGARNADGCGRIKIRIEGRHVQTLVSRVVYVLEHDVEPGQQLVLHGPCDRPECCAIEHLRLGSYADNVRDMLERGRARIGFDHPHAKLRAIDLEFILSRLATHTDVQIAAALGHLVCRRTICGIRRGETWAHITGIERQRDRLTAGGVR